MRPGEGDFNVERLQWAEVALGQDDLDSVRPRAARAQRDVRHGALLVDVEVGLGRGGCGQEARRRRQTEAGGQANDDESDDDLRSDASDKRPGGPVGRSEEHTPELQQQMRISYAVYHLKKKN